MRRAVGVMSVLLIVASSGCTFGAINMFGRKRARGDYTIPAVVDVGLAIATSYLARDLMRQENAAEGTPGECNNPDYAERQQTTCWSGLAIVTAAGFTVASVAGIVMAATSDTGEGPIAPPPPRHDPTLSRALDREHEARATAMYAELEATALQAAVSGQCTTIYPLIRELRVRNKARFDAAVARAPAFAACTATLPPARDVDPIAPKTLDRAAIQAGIDTAREGMQRCRTTEHGHVTLAIKVAPDGAVVYALVRTAPNRALGECVSATIRTATFAPTQDGATFTFPFVF